jgi:type VI protein secretion system component Hcp
MSTYIKIDGIEGHITHEGFKGYSEVLAYSYTMERNIAQKVGNITDREGKAPEVSPFTFTQEVDTTKPYMLQHIAKGDSIKTVVMKTMATNGREYNEITLSDVLVGAGTENYDRSTLAVDDRSTLKPTITYKLYFTQIEFKNTPVDGTHKSGSAATSGYNLATGKAS